MGNLEHLRIGPLVVKLVVSMPAPKLTFDKDSFELIAAHHQASKTGSDRENCGKLRVVVKGLKVTVDSKAIVHDAASDISTLGLDICDEVGHPVGKFNELIKIDNHDPLFGTLRQLAHFRDGFRAAGKAARDVEIIVLNYAVATRRICDVIRQIRRRGDMELGDAKTVIVSKEMGQETGVVENANEKLQVYSPGLIETA